VQVSSQRYNAATQYTSNMAALII